MLWLWINDSPNDNRDQICSGYVVAAVIAAAVCCCYLFVVVVATKVVAVDKTKPKINFSQNKSNCLPK